MPEPSQYRVIDWNDYRLGDWIDIPLAELFPDHDWTPGIADRGDFRIGGHLFRIVYNIGRDHFDVKPSGHPAWPLPASLTQLEFMDWMRLNVPDFECLWGT